MSTARRQVNGVPFVALVALLTFWGLTIVAGARTPGYDTIDDPMSVLIAQGAPRASIMVLAYLMLTLATCTLTIALRRRAAFGAATRNVQRALIVAATGALGAALFRTDADGPTVFSGSARNLVHYVFLGLFFAAALGAMALAALALRRSNERLLRPATFVLLAIAVPATLAMGAFLPDRELLGAIERLALAAPTTWMALVALRLS